MFGSTLVLCIEHANKSRLEKSERRMNVMPAAKFRNDTKNIKWKEREKMKKREQNYT